MKNQLTRNFSVALLAAASMYVLMAESSQAPQKLAVQVPFGFHVGNSMLPSGKYTVDTDAAPDVVRLRSANAKSTLLILAQSVQAPGAPRQGKLVFHRYGDEYFLSQSWKRGDDMGRELGKSRREIELAASAQRDVQSIMAKQ